MGKKTLLLLGFFYCLIIFGCVSSTTQTKKVNSTAKTIDLADAALSLADQLNLSLKGKQLGRFAVADPVGPGKRLSGLGEQIADNLSVQLFQTLQFTDFVERKQFKQLLANIVSEKDVPYFDQNTVADYGKSIGLQDTVIGTIRDLGDYYYVIMKIVNIETTKTLAMAQINLAKTTATATLAQNQQTATLTVNVTPAIQGTAIAGGVKRELENGIAVFNKMPYGNCPIIIQPYSGYDRVTDNINIKSPVETLSIRISQKKYDVSFTITPPDAILVIDGKKIELNEWGFAKITGVKGGNHSLLLKTDKKGYTNKSDQFNPAVKNSFNIDLKTTDPIYKFNDTLFQKVMEMKEKQDFNVKLWTNQKSYRPGDKIAFYFSSEKDCYLNIVDIGTSGNITLLFPNTYHPDSKISAGRTYKIPDETSHMFGFQVDPPAGRERVYAIASTRPLNIFSNNFRGVPYQSMTRGKTRDISVTTAADSLSGAKLNAAFTCVIDVVE